MNLKRSNDYASENTHNNYHSNSSTQAQFNSNYWKKPNALITGVSTTNQRKKDWPRAWP